MLLGGTIPPCLVLKASLLLPTNEEICALLFLKTSTWLELEDVPFYPPDKKGTIGGEWSWSQSPKFDQQAVEAETMEYYPLDDAR